MNERIKDLARQAGLEFDDDEALEFGKEIYYVTKEDMEKFAELIVRECLKQIDTIRDSCDEDGDRQQALGADWAGLAVSRHFGVNDD